MYLFSCELSSRQKSQETASDAVDRCVSLSGVCWEQWFLSLSFQPNIFSKAAQSLKYASPLLIRDCLSSLGTELTSGEAKYENETRNLVKEKTNNIQSENRTISFV